MKVPVQFDDLARAILEVLPYAEFGEDFEGQLVIYTGLHEIEDDLYDLHEIVMDIEADQA